MLLCWAAGWVRRSATVAVSPLSVVPFIDEMPGAEPRLVVRVAVGALDRAGPSAARMVSCSWPVMQRSPVNGIVQLSRLARRRQRPIGLLSGRARSIANSCRRAQATV